MRRQHKIIKFLYNPWVIGSAFYLLGLLTPKTIIKKEITNVVTQNYFESAGNNLNGFYFFLFFIILFFLIAILLIHNFLDKE